MNRKPVIYSLVLVVILVASIQVPAVAATNGNGIRPNPEVQRVGLVIDYIPGQSITILDRAGTQFTFELATPKILPFFRAPGLGRGSFVTIIAPNNVPGGKHIGVGIVIHTGVPPGFPTPPNFSPRGPSTPQPPTEFPPPEIPNIPTDDKPDTPFSPYPLPPLPPLRPGIGYNFPSDFPDWAMALRAAVFENITIAPAETFTPVGVVEIGSDQINPNIYLVEIDLVTTADEVQGRFSSLTTPVITAADTFDVTFLRMPQALNPERTNSPYEEFQTLDPAPTSFSTIYADGVCFVVTTADGPIKYCSKPSRIDEPDSPISVMDNFPSQYAGLQDLISPIAQQFGLLDVIQLDQILSMQEDVQHIYDCASELTQQACGADIVVAPVMGQYFQQQFNGQIGRGEENNVNDEDDEDDGDNGSSSQPTPIPVGVAKVLRPVDTAIGTIQPGDYRIDYWFDANGVFFAATLTGVMTDNTQVTNQQVPAVPAVLINVSTVPRQPPTQISACRIFRRCLWFQSTCG